MITSAISRKSHFHPGAAGLPVRRTPFGARTGLDFFGKVSIDG
jgi:hypothetical protein